MNWYCYFKEQSGHYPAPRCEKHIREPRYGRRQECSLGCVAARARESVTNAPRLRARTTGRGNGSEFLQFRRHQTAPPRQQVQRSRHKRKAPPRDSAKGLSISGARDRARTGDPHVGKEMLALILLRNFDRSGHIDAFRSIVGEGFADLASRRCSTQVQ